MPKNQGFTLIEIIVVLLLVGIMTALAGMGLVSGVQGYLLARENSELAQKGQIAMDRMRKELTEADEDDIKSFSATEIVFSTPGGERAFGLSDNGKSIMFLNATTVNAGDAADSGFVLVDNVSDFTMSRNSTDDLISIDLTLQHNSGDTDISFETRVNTRNSRMLNGPHS